MKNICSSLLFQNCMVVHVNLGLVCTCSGISGKGIHLKYVSRKACACPIYIVSRFLSHSRLFDNVLTESRYKPYLIFIYATWCFPCMNAEPIWEKVVSDLEPIGEFFLIIPFRFSSVETIHTHRGGRRYNHNPAGAGFLNPP